MQHTTPAGAQQPRVFDGRPASGLRHPDMRSYRKLPVEVTAIQQDQQFAVTVSWQNTPLDGQPGDWLITDGNSSWPVDAAIFAKTYQRVAGDRYIKVANVMAIQLDEPFVVITLEGRAEAVAGDYLVQGPEGEAWPIRQAEFEATYRLAD